MGCGSKNHKGGRRHRHLAVFFLVLVISASSQLILFNAEGRKLADNSRRVNEENAIFGAKVGSRPPRCERRCSSCAHCEAIQLPTNPQQRTGARNSTTLSAIAYARGDDDSSNYKPMSWKCKCGGLIFNP